MEGPLSAKLPTARHTLADEINNLYNDLKANRIYV
jgi:hypothetical protein